MKSNFEEDIKVLRLKLRDSDDYARAFYCALCNMQWKKLGSDNLYSCTWRYAGGLVARLRNKGEDYLHFLRKIQIDGYKILEREFFGS